MLLVSYYSILYPIIKSLEFEKKTRLILLKLDRIIKHVQKVQNIPEVKVNEERGERYQRPKN